MAQDGLTFGVMAIEGSYQSSDKDMGKTHEDIHQHQRNYKRDFEPLVEELTDTSINDIGYNLALKKAHEVGVKSPEEWKEYNEGLRPSRRKDSYEEYLLGLSSNFIKGKERALDKKLLSSEKRRNIRTELTYIKQNHNLPVYGTLYYLGSVKDYDNKTLAQIDAIRKAKAETLREFFKSPAFQELHPGLFRAELHFDERGDLHAQSQELFVNVDKRGRVSFSQRAVLKKLLTARFGEKELNRRLNMLCYAHRQVPKQGKDKKGTERADFKYLNMAINGADGGAPDKLPNYSQAEKNTRLIELARIEDFYNLTATAERVFPKYGLHWTWYNAYATDGRHRTAPEYTDDLASERVERDLSASKKELKETTEKTQKVSEELSELNKSIKQKKQDKKSLTNDLDEVQKSLDQAQKAQAAAAKQLQQVQQNIKKLKEDEKQRQQRIKRLDNQIEEQEQHSKDLDTQIEHKRGLLSKVEDRLKAANQRLKQVEENIQSNVYRKAFKAVYPAMLALMAVFYKKPAHDLKNFNYDQAARDIGSNSSVAERNQQHLKGIKADALAVAPQRKQVKSVPKQIPKSEPKKPTDDGPEF